MPDPSCWTCCLKPMFSGCAASACTRCSNAKDFESTISQSVIPTSILAVVIALSVFGLPSSLKSKVTVLLTPFLFFHKVSGSAYFTPSHHTPCQQCFDLEQVVIFSIIFSGYFWARQRVNRKPMKAILHGISLCSILYILTSMTWELKNLLGTPVRTAVSLGLMILTAHHCPDFYSDREVAQLYVVLGLLCASLPFALYLFHLFGMVVYFFVCAAKLFFYPTREVFVNISGRAYNQNVAKVILKLWSDPSGTSDSNRPSLAVMHVVRASCLYFVAFYCCGFQDWWCGCGFAYCLNRVLRWICVGDDFGWHRRPFESVITCLRYRSLVVYERPRFLQAFFMFNHILYTPGRPFVQRFHPNLLSQLDLSGCFLETLPIISLHMPKLQYLNLSDNELTILPPHFCELKQLESLNLEGNRLTTLPKFLGQLSKLHTLNLARNPITHLPFHVMALLSRKAFRVFLPTNHPSISLMAGRTVISHLLTTNFAIFAFRNVVLQTSWRCQLHKTLCAFTPRAHQCILTFVLCVRNRPASIGFSSNHSCLGPTVSLPVELIFEILQFLKFQDFCKRT
eukprot:m.270472 g.270472  ORF g.270472 m.270472 type:complete len:567 (+) comp47619_c0_seq1:3-1703(+)